MKQSFPARIHFALEAKHAVDNVFHAANLILVVGIYKLIVFGLLSPLAPSLLSAGGVWWTEKLHLTQLSAIAQRLESPFEDPIAVQNGAQSAVVRSCADYFRYRRQGFAPASDMELRVLRSWGVDCDALRLLENVKPPARSFLRGFQLGVAVIGVLPPQLATALSKEKALEAKQAEEKGMSWGTYAPRARARHRGNQLLVTDGNTRTTLEVYARGDFDNDGIEDILVRDDSEVIGGTYANSRLFLLTRSAESELLKIVSVY